VIGSDGSLTGYAGGIDRKVALLRLESVRLAPTALRMRRAIH
jgi:methylated-DNA-[protein]-cysteine S-methyltransferase